MSVWKSGVANWPLLTVVGLIVLSVFTAWLGLREIALNAPRDFEECAEQTQNAPAGEHNALMTACGARFAGRRKAGGGYTYYDFMQNRHFDIAGPNPTAEERKRIDLEYMHFLDHERRDVLAAELAQQRAEQLVATFESALAAGPPTILLPKSAPAKPSKPLVADSDQHCKIKGSLSCSWTKLKSVVRNALASAAEPRAH
jgi:hypothetical protein